MGISISDILNNPQQALQELDTLESKGAIAADTDKKIKELIWLLIAYIVAMSKHQDTSGIEGQIAKVLGSIGKVN